jgi:hypothetical protein
LKNTQSLHGFLCHERGRLLGYTVLGAGALSLSLLAAWWGLHGRALQTGAATAPALAAAQPATSPAANPYGPMVVGLGPWARSAALAEKQRQTASLEGQQSSGFAGKVESAPAPQDDQQIAEAAPEYPAADVPLPPRRPLELKNLASRAPAPSPMPMRQAALPAQPAPVAPPADNRTFFEKIFGAADQNQQPAAAPQPAPAGRNARRQQQAPAQALAYAPQESGGGLFGGLTRPAAPVAPAPAPVTTARAGAGTAVYDISAHVVHMPDGTKLEAHSGLGQHLDDPRFVHVRMKGPTPPSVYALSPREALFHGVEALRLTPVSGEVFGRAGLLAHTFMLGPNGDSNGCVSFRDYNAFLQAYKRGDVRRLVVVARM